MGAPAHTDFLELQILLQHKNQISGVKLCVAFLFFDFERNYEVLKSKSLCFLLNKNIIFNKNKTESKMENPIHFWRDEPCASAHIRIKTVMSQWCIQRVLDDGTPKLLKIV